MSKPLLELSNVVLGYGRTEVIRGVSLAAAEGERVCILGGNGSGKSTLMKSMSGFLVPRSGTVSYDGVGINDVPAHLRFGRGIVYIPQDRRLFANKSVNENLDLGCLSLGLPAAEMRHRLDRVFAYFPFLAEKRNVRAGALSGGEQQTVAVGRALMGKPRVLLLDEPSAGLAPVWIDRMFDVLTTIVADLRLTLVIVEQNIHVGLDISERGYVIQNGLLALERPSAELRRSEDLVRSYLGG
jgi:branched-chain amino acid transport system ATP-binding protein